MPGCAETQYIFDSSFELGYITADVYDWLYDLDFNLDRIVDYSNGDISLDELRSEMGSLNIRELYYDNNQERDIQTLVTDYFDINYEHMDLTEKCFYDLMVMFGNNDQPESMKSHLAKRISDCYFGNNWHTPIRKIESEDLLSDRKFQLEIMQKDLVTSNWINRMANRRRQAIDNLSKVDVGELRNLLIKKRDARERKFQEHQRMIQNLRFDGDQVYLADESDFSLNEVRQIEQRKQYKNKFDKKSKKNARKAITRAVNLFGKFFNKDDIEGFIKGYEYVIEGKKFNYRLTKTDRTNLLLNTISPNNIHIPYDLEITNKDNIVLAKACYLFENTPIIDQIIAFTMMIKSGNEDEFIQKANLFSTTNAYRESELYTLKRALSPVKEYGEGGVDLLAMMDNHVLTTLYNGRQEHEIWTNRINDSLDSLFAESIGATLEEWHLLCYPNENFGALMNHPSLLGPQVRLLTNGVE